jgi:hypothetical protein
VRNCDQCGGPLKADARFCASCGSAIAGGQNTPDLRSTDNSVEHEKERVAEIRERPKTVASIEREKQRVAPTITTSACPNCGRDWGNRIACQSCGQLDSQPVGVQLASAGRRLGSYLLAFLLFVVTLGIGYIVWALIVWKDGTTPPKQVLKMKVIKVAQNEKAGWWRMFLRFVAKSFFFLFAWIGAFLSMWLLFDRRRQELWDKIAGTIVVHDPQKLL